MTRIALPAASAALLAALAACSPPPSGGPAPQTAAVAPPTAAPSAPATGGAQAGLDGTYYAPPGGATGNQYCGTTRFGYPIRVSGGVARVQTVTQGELSGPVAPDGSLDIQHGNAAVRGNFSGGKFTGYYTVRSCAMTLNYAKR